MSNNYTVKFDNGWLAYDNKGALASGYPTVLQNPDRAAKFPTVEKALSAWSDARGLYIRSNFYDNPIPRRGRVLAAY